MATAEPTSRGGRGRAAALALALAAAATARATPAVCAAEELRPHAAAIHVHSTFSNGELDVVELAELARDRGIDVLVLTDSLLTRVTWTAWPLDRTGIPGLNRRSRPAVLDHGLRDYLDAVERAQREVPEVVVVAGVEVAPSYTWHGTPWGGLELHDFDRHLWVAGLGESELRHLPVIENESWSNTRFAPRRLVLPAVLLVVGTALALGGSRRRIRPAAARSSRMRRAGAVAAVASGLLVAWNNAPFGVLGGDPYQRVIDYVRERGGVIYWSYPEAKYPDVELGGAAMVSRPHPGDLLRTDAYHGFEGLYGDDIRATEPGGVWDRALLEHATGGRKTLPYVVTGIDFHGLVEGGDAWRDLDGGVTVLLMDDTSATAAIEALASGRAYATYSGDRRPLRLAVFEVSPADGVAGSHGASLSGGSPVAVAWELVWGNDGPPASPVFDVTIVCDGEVVHRARGPLPLAGRAELDLPPGNHVVRLAADAGRRHRLLSNPVLVSTR